MCPGGASSDGRSRQIAFVGFKTAQQAQEAVAYFSRTFMDTWKLSVEVRGGPLAEAWRHRRRLSAHIAHALAQPVCSPTTHTAGEAHWPCG